MAYRVGLLSKYPPLEGGIAAKTYWLAQGLAARGLHVSVITHPASAGGAYRIDAQPHTLREEGAPVIRPVTEVPWHLPEDEERTLSLLDRAINAIEDDHLQVIDSGYLVPYGIVGDVAKRVTGVGHVLRHGGSDIEKFLKRGVLGRLLREALAQADVVVTEERHAGLFEDLAKRVVYQPPYVPNESAFVPSNNASIRGRVALIGKINYYWQQKGLDKLAAIMALLADEFECWIVGQGNGLGAFRSSLDPSLVSRLRWYPFVHPSRMPDLLDQLDAVFIFESGLPHPAVSNLALEAMRIGVGIVTDRADFAQWYRSLVSTGDDHILITTPDEPGLASEEIRSWICSRKRLPTPRQIVSFDTYLSANEAIYESIIVSG